MAPSATVPTAFTSAACAGKLERTPYDRFEIHVPAGDHGPDALSGSALAFRGKQVFVWLHKGARSFEEMTNLPKPLRESLAQTCQLTPPKVARKQVSRQDGTIKYLWELADGNCIESVLMRYHHGNTVCISSQVGCRMGCAFCASTIAGKVRNLAPAEMLDQVLFTQLDSGLDISNIVLMGIGRAHGQSGRGTQVPGTGESSRRDEHRHAAYLSVYLAASFRESGAWRSWDCS